jgi:maleate cis-trans isomerase
MLEQDSGTPVIAYTHATFFAAFKALGLRDSIHGHGRLLASLADAA